MTARALDGSFTCWQCGGSLAGVPLPLSQREVCGECHADLHVCRMCAHARFGGGFRCREERAEPPGDPGRANFCDYLELKPGAHEAGDSAESARARAELAALFGDAEPTPPAGDEDAAPSADEEARAALNKLFGLDDS